jgi:DNA repair protein RecN (Recombination protein N)
MLTQIFVKDLAIVSTLDLTLQAGMTALTGETGAGKSILIDALGLALGDKTDNSMIRSGCERAEINAEFDLRDCPPALEWLREQGLDDEEQCLLRRQLVLDSRSRAFINGRPVPMQQLQELGAMLLDIHGQHAHQSLLRAVEQRRLLDDYAGNGRLLEQCADLFRRYNDARRRLEDLQAAARDRDSRLELLEYQRDELQALSVTEEEVRELDEEQRRLRNTGRLQEVGGTLLLRLFDDDRSIQGSLTRALAELDELVPYAAALEEARELIDSALIQVQESAGGLRGFVDDLELDPERLEQVEQRIADLHDMGRKYRVEPQELPARLGEILAELGELEHAGQTLDALEQEVAELRRQYLEIAAALGDARRKAAERLSGSISEAMQTLAMTGGRFEVAVGELPREKAGPAGMDTVDFRVSANPGQPLQPLAKVASGGELSRISLAIQVATAECAHIPTLIFDEVDVGIGGRVAEIVGQLLRRLGDSRQVLTVTHLPQVAAQAHHHLQVSKQARDGQTYTGITPLSSSGRVEEVARMLGGVEITERTLEHAREMLGIGD